MEDDYLDLDDYSDEDPFWMKSDCQNCGIEYDNIDYEYQICSHCKHENKPPYQ